MEKQSHPSKLYKFHSFNENALSSLINEVVWFSKREHLNDPFEVINIKEHISDKNYEKAWRKRLSSLNFPNHKKEKELKKLISEKDNRIKNGISLISDGMKAIGLYCLTDYPENILMWSHYADSHKGFCIEYKVTPKHIIRMNNHIRKVSYTKRYPQLSALDFMPCGECDTCKMSNSLTLENHFQCRSIGKGFDKLCGSKSKDWKYEKEYRIIYEGEQYEKKLLGFTRPYEEIGLAISAIICGSKMPDNHQATLKKLLQNKVPFRNAQLSKREYKMVNCR